MNSKYTKRSHELKAYQRGYRQAYCGRRPDVLGQKNEHYMRGYAVGTARRNVIAGRD